ncbi:MAG: hypothetical protein ACP5U1_17100 [Desulfomonilaceae bacterium]
MRNAVCNRNTVILGKKNPSVFGLWTCWPASIEISNLGVIYDCECVKKQKAPGSTPRLSAKEGYRVQNTSVNLQHINLFVSPALPHVNEKVLRITQNVLRKVCARIEKMCDIAHDPD